MIDLIVSQGRIADRKAGTIPGAAYTAKALEDRYGLVARSFGESAPPVSDDWRHSLPQAKETLTALKSAVADSAGRGNLPVMVANTCSASLATLPIAARNDPDIVVLWVDAHGDFNTPDTTDSGYLGGMVVAAACGLWDSGHGVGIRPGNVVLLGARDIDEPENELLENSGVRIIPPAEATPESVLNAIGSSKVWIHVDWDAMEPGYIPADYAVSGGLLPAQLQAIFEAIPNEQISGVEFAEFLAPGTERERNDALSILLDTVAPLFETVPAE